MNPQHSSSISFWFVISSILFVQLMIHILRSAFRHTGSALPVSELHTITQLARTSRYHMPDYPRKVVPLRKP